MKTRVSETFSKLLEAGYVINIAQYSTNCASLEGHKDKEHEQRTLQIIRSTLLSDTNVSIMSGSLQYLHNKGRESTEVVDIT